MSFIMTKERMELHENRAKKQLYHRFWRSIPERMSKGVEHFFYRLGMHITQNPYKWILGCCIIMLFCLSGLFRFRQEKNPMKLWSPPDSGFALDTEWLMSHFEEGLRIQTFILTGNNVLEQQALIRLNEITKQMISIQAPIEKISWTDVCKKIPSIANYMHRMKRQSSLSEDDFFDDDVTSKINQTFEPAIHMDTKTYCEIINNLPTACLMFSILDIWNFDSAKIEKDSTEEIIAKINTVKVSPTLGHSMNFSELLGGVTLDEKGRIIAATAIKTELMVHIKFRDVDMDKSGNNAGTADWATYEVLTWESAYLELAKKLSTELQSEKNNDSLAFYYEAGRSYGDLSGTAMFRDIDKLIIGVALMFLYVLMILSNHNWVEWRFCLTSVGLFCVGIAFILAVGICSLIGIPYGPIHTSLPFLLLGLGVDDIFVFHAYWKQIHTDELNLSKSLTERIGLTLGLAGSAITVTSFTDIVAFIIGATTILPSLRSFCIYAAVGIFVTYLLQITFFIASFTLDARRIEQKRNGMLPCIVHENFTPKLLDPSNAFSWKFIHALYSRIILTMPGKIIIIIITFATMSISIVGMLQLKQGFDPALLVPKGSYFDQYIITSNQKFDQGFEAFVLMGDDIDYSSEFSKITSLTERLKNASFIQNIEPWPINFAKFVSTYYDTDLKTTKIADDNFYHYLSKFLFSQDGGKYQRNFVFNETFTCGKNAPRIIATTIEFKFTRFVSPSEWIPAMDDSKQLVSKAQIEGYATVWSKAFGPWTSDKMVTQEVTRNLILALICVMITTTILIAEVQTCCWILLCILLTLLNVCGFMYFWGQPIDMVSSIGLQLAIGLSVDYAAHVAHTFLHTESPKDDDDAPRTTRALIAVRHIGAAVAYGAGSTLLAVSMLAFSTSYVFIAFFRIFFLVILFGLWHGLIMLPVVLSIIGPPSLHATQRQPMSVAVVDDED